MGFFFKKTLVAISIAFAFTFSPIYYSCAEEIANPENCIDYFGSLIKSDTATDADPFIQIISKLKENQTNFFEIPIPFDTQFDIYAITKTANGQIFHVKPSILAADVKALEGANHVPQSTFYQNASDFFDFMGFKERCHPSVGCYFTTFPSATEFMARKKLWNEMAIAEGHPERVIEMTYLAGDVAPMQRGMARNMVQYGGATHMQDPTKVFTERYAPIGGGQHEMNDFTKLHVDPNTGKVAIKGSLGHHDLFELINSPFIPREVLDHYVNQADAYLKMLDILKGKQVWIKGDDIDEFKATFKKFVNTKKADTSVDDLQEGITAERYLEFLLHNAMAAQHTDFHLGQWLARHPAGIDPMQLPEFGWGNTFQKEIQMHLARVGTRTPNSKPPFAAPMVIENFKLADDTGKVLTLESLLQHTINVGNERFKNGFERIYAAVSVMAKNDNSSSAADAKSILKKLNQLKDDHLIFQQHTLSKDERSLLAMKYREKVDAISSYTKKTDKRKPFTSMSSAEASIPISDIRNMRSLDSPQNNKAALRAMQNRVNELVGLLTENAALSATRKKQLAQVQAILDFPNASYNNLPADLKSRIFRLTYVARQEALTKSLDPIGAKASALIEDFEAVARTYDGIPIQLSSSEKIRLAINAAINEVEKKKVTLFSAKASNLARERENMFVTGFLNITGHDPEMEILARRLSKICQAGGICGDIDKFLKKEIDQIEFRESPILLQRRDQ